MHMHHPRSDGRTDAQAMPCASTSLRKASRAVGRLYDAALEPTGLSANQLSILRTIERMDGPLLSRLSERMVMDRTSLYRALAPMERDGWVRVEAAGGRSKRVALTAEGRAVSERAAAAWDDVQGRFVGAIGLDRWESFAATLRDLTRTARSLDRVSPGPDGPR
jgi:DNA-binding MarR family transcriptional regulator